MESTPVPLYVENRPCTSRWQLCGCKALGGHASYCMDALEVGGRGRISARGI